jgi:hypothetical protein
MDKNFNSIESRTGRPSGDMGKLTDLCNEVTYGPDDVVSIVRKFEDGRMLYNYYGSNGSDWSCLNIVFFNIYGIGLNILFNHVCGGDLFEAIDYYINGDDFGLIIRDKDVVDRMFSKLKKKYSLPGDEDDFFVEAAYMLRKLEEIYEV